MDAADRVLDDGISDVHNRRFIDCSVHLEVRRMEYDRGLIIVMSGGSAGPVESLLRTLDGAARPPDASPYLVAVYDAEYWLLDYKGTGGISEDARMKLSRWLRSPKTTGQLSSRIPDAVLLFGESFTETSSGGSSLREQAVLLARPTNEGRALAQIAKGMRPPGTLILTI